MAQKLLSTAGRDLVSLTLSLTDLHLCPQSILSKTSLLYHQVQVRSVKVKPFPPTEVTEDFVNLRLGDDDDDSDWEYEDDNFNRNAFDFIVDGDGE